MISSGFNAAANGLEYVSRGIDVLPLDAALGIGTVASELGAGGTYALAESFRWADDAVNFRAWNMLVRPLTASIETAITMCPMAEYPIEAINLMTGINVKKLPSSMLLSTPEAEASSPKLGA